MSKVRRTASAVTLLGALALSVPTLAQFSPATVPTRTSNAGESPRNSAILIFPASPFVFQGARTRINADGTISTSGNTTQTLAGFMIGAETGTATANDEFAFSVGGWYWYHSSNSNAYELHLKAFYNRTYGIQVGILGPQQSSIPLSGQTQKSGDSPFDVFGVYHFGSSKSTLRNPWSIQIGAGLFDDPSSLNRANDFVTTTGFTAFIEGSLQIQKNLDLNATYWYLNDAGADLHRFGLGVGYRF